MPCLRVVDYLGRQALRAVLEPGEVLREHRGGARRRAPDPRAIAQVDRAGIHLAGHGFRDQLLHRRVGGDGLHPEAMLVDQPSAALGGPVQHDRADESQRQRAPPCRRRQRDEARQDHPRAGQQREERGGPERPVVVVVDERRHLGRQQHRIGRVLAGHVGRNGRAGAGAVQPGGGVPQRRTAPEHDAEQVGRHRRQQQRNREVHDQRVDVGRPVRGHRYGSSVRSAAARGEASWRRSNAAGILPPAAGTS